MRLHLTPEQIARRRQFMWGLFWSNVLFFTTNMVIAFTFGNIPCFFAAGLCGFVALYLWDHA